MTATTPGHRSVVLVGLGTIAATHLAVLASRDDVELVAVVDADPQRSTDLHRHSPLRYTDLAEALEVHSPDVVVVATPTSTHAVVVGEVLARSAALVLVEKPLAHDLDALGALRIAVGERDAAGRVLVCHHFAFSPEVTWAACLLAEHPAWGPVTELSAVFADPYAPLGPDAFGSYGSSWIDSGVNQLSMLTRFLQPVELCSRSDSPDGLTTWATVAFTSGGAHAMGRLLTTWEAAASTKRSMLRTAEGIEVWLDHTGMTGMVCREGELLAALGNDGSVPRKVAHYAPLYASALSVTPDPVLSLDAATAVLEVLYASPSAAVRWPSSSS